MTTGLSDRIKVAAAGLRSVDVLDIRLGIDSVVRFHISGSTSRSLSFHLPGW